MKASKRFNVEQNVIIRVIDKCGKLIQERSGHNAATNTLIEGVGHYLAGEGILNQGYDMLSEFVPKYISLGTMGLRNQDRFDSGLPKFLIGSEYVGNDAIDFKNYLNQLPGFGADGYSRSYNNDRSYFGLGPAYTSFSVNKSYYKGDIVTYQGVAYVANEDMIVNPEIGIYGQWSENQWSIADKQPTCFELISPTFPRQEISFRDIVPEYESESPKTIDVIFSAMISSGALSDFRDSDKDYLFITEAGLWSTKDYLEADSGVNGLLAGYRLTPSDKMNWLVDPEDVPDEWAVDRLHDRGIDNPTPAQIAAEKVVIARENRDIVRQNVLCVEKDQVVQVIWKIQIGNVDDSLGEVTMSIVSGDALNQLQAQIDQLAVAVKDAEKAVYARSVVVNVSNWKSGSFPEYPYYANIKMVGIDSTYQSVVQFEDSDCNDFEFSPTSNTSSNIVTIYCATKPTRTIILPMVLCAKRKEVGASAQ